MNNKLRPITVALVLLALFSFQNQLATALADNRLQTDVLYVANEETGAITEYSSSGAYLGVFATNGVNTPTGLVFDSGGNLYVANLEVGMVTEYNASGAYLGEFANSDYLNFPEGLAFDSNDNLYVVDASYGRTAAITEFNSSGAYLDEFASTGMSSSAELVFDNRGNLYVANYGNNTITEYNASGTYLGVFASTGLNKPCGLVFDSNGNLYVTDYGNNTITEYSSSGAYLGVFASTGLNWPTGLVFGAAPKPATPTLTVVPTTSQPGLLVLQLSGTSGQTNWMETSTDLVNWTVVATNTLTSASLYITNAINGGISHQYWRAYWP